MNLSDAEIVKLCECACDLGARHREHPLTIIKTMLPSVHNNPLLREETYNKCHKWLFENQHRYPYFIDRRKNERPKENDKGRVN